MKNSLQMWIHFLEQAAKPFASDGADSLTVAFHVPGCIQGAVHVAVPGDRATSEEAARLAKALEAIDAQSNAQLKAVWQGVTHVAGTGVRVDVEELPQRKVIENLHIAQSIREAQRLSEDSVLAVCNQVRSMLELATNHSDGLKRVADQFAQEGDSSSSRNITGTMQRLAEQLKAFGQEVMDRTNRQAKDIEQARVWTNDIVKLGQAIAAIASNARILTFNARLESARIGEAGRGFAVIAASIQDLATQVRQTNQSVSDLAANLLHALPALGNDALQTSNAAREAVSRLESQLIDVQNHLADARTASWEALNESSTAASELREKAHSVIGHLQFQDRASQMMQEVEAQATAVLELAGLSEREVGKEVIEQVGAIGRTLDGGEAARPMGHVELF